MPIKKRSPLTEDERAARIAAFGDAATAQHDGPGETSESAAATRATVTTKAEPKLDEEAEETVAPTTLIRWPKDGHLRVEIGQIAKEEDRSVHSMILRLLRDGIDAHNAKR